MNKIILFVGISILATSFEISFNGKRSTDKCCASCELPKVKYYSIPNNIRCG